MPDGRRTGDAAGGFSLAARKIMHRAADIPAAAYAATAFLFGTLDWLNPWQGQDIMSAHEIDACQRMQQDDHLYPRL